MAIFVINVLCYRICKMRLHKTETYSLKYNDNMITSTFSTHKHGWRAKPNYGVNSRTSPCMAQAIFVPLYLTEWDNGKHPCEQILIFNLNDLNTRHVTWWSLLVFSLIYPESWRYLRTVSIHWRLVSHVWPQDQHAIACCIVAKVHVSQSPQRILSWVLIKVYISSGMTIYLVL